MADSELAKALTKALDDAYNRFKKAEAMQIAMENSMKKKSWEYNPEEMGIIRKLPLTELKITDGGKQITENYDYRIRVYAHKETARRIFGINRLGNRLGANHEACVRECESTMEEVINLLKKINCPYRIEDLKEKDLERLIITIEVTDTEKKPDALVDEINDPISRFKPY